jgi:hypothetical protein
MKLSHNLSAMIGQVDIVFITLDTLRYDVAQRAHRSEQTPCLSQWLGADGWERRHSPGNFTYAAHQAFFAGFLPTPACDGPHPRLFASRFEGSETTVNESFVFDEPNVIAALRARNYRTICIGGVGFFNKRTQLGSTLPDMFCESHWNESMGVTNPDSTERQVQVAIQRVGTLDSAIRCFLFLNISALHQPNYFYLPNAQSDSKDSMLAAMVYVDRWIGTLLNFFEERLRRGNPSFWIICSDHGTAYGEGGYHGHRLNHEVVGDVPYKHFLISDRTSARE